MTVEYTFKHGKQSIEGEAIDFGHEPRLRAYVDLDSYEFQSSARVYSWTEVGWKEITSKPFGDTRSAGFSHASPRTEEKEAAWQSAMREDLDELLGLARRFFGDQG